MGLSHVAVVTDWAVTKTVTEDGVQVVEVVRARSLLTSDGLYWAVDSLVDNFKDFPPLAIVLVGMLGIGLADRSGLITAALKALLVALPEALVRALLRVMPNSQGLGRAIRALPRYSLTPIVFFVGVLSSLALDAGYVVLPPDRGRALCLDGALAAGGPGRRLRRRRSRIQREPDADRPRCRAGRLLHRGREHPRPGLRRSADGQPRLHDRVDLPVDRGRLGGDGALGRTAARRQGPRRRRTGSADTGGGTDAERNGETGPPGRGASPRP